MSATRVDALGQRDLAGPQLNSWSAELDSLVACDHTDDGWQGALDALESSHDSAEATLGAWDSALDNLEVVEDSPDLDDHEADIYCSTLALPSPVLSDIHLNLMYAARREPAPDSFTVDLTTKLLSTGDKRKVSLAAEADAKNINPKQLRRHKNLTSALSVVYEQSNWLALEGRLVAAAAVSGSELDVVAYFEFASYDGVDFTITGKSAAATGVSQAALEAESSQLVSAVDPKFVQLQFGVSQRESNSATHILQYNGGTVLLCRTRGKFFIIQASHWMAMLMEAFFASGSKFQNVRMSHNQEWFVKLCRTNICENPCTLFSEFGCITCET
jgi:hypothetical protein